MPVEGKNSSRVLSDNEFQFVVWAFHALGWQRTEVAAVTEFTLPEMDLESGRYARAEPATYRQDIAHQLTLQSQPVRWLLEQLRHGPVLHASPVDQPTSVHEISGRLFAAYTVENGTVRLGGCTLERRPVVRISYWYPNGDSARRLRHDYLTTQGEWLSDKLQTELGLSHLTAVEEHPRVADADVVHWCETAADASRASVIGRESHDEIAITTLIWCTYAAGKIEFEIGDASDSVAFAGWARPLSRGTSSAPPFRCGHSADSSYDVAGTDDGRITTQAMLALCKVSGQRTVASELEECAVTGQHVLPALLVECPLSGKRLLPAALLTCSLCRQNVSPLAVRDGRCAACRKLRRVSKDDPRMARILGEHPQLDRWPRWRLSETSQVYIACASSFFRRLLFVVDKESLDLLRIAAGHRLSKRWVDAPPADHQEYT